MDDADWWGEEVQSKHTSTIVSMSLKNHDHFSSLHFGRIKKPPENSLKGNQNFSFYFTAKTVNF
jgi:hypothetical protein